MSSAGLTVTQQVHFAVRARGRRQFLPAAAPVHPPVPAGKVPRVARLMALAIRFDALISSGAVADQAELARVGHVTRARVTQIMNLLLLAPDIQEAILHLPRTLSGRDPFTERDLRAMAAEIHWSRQRAMWSKLTQRPSL